MPTTFKPAKKSSKTYTTFYFVHLPILALALLLLVATGYVSYSATNALTGDANSNTVLGSEDEKEEEHEEEDKDNDGDKDEDKDDDKDGEHKEEEKRKEDEEKERERYKKEQERHEEELREVVEKEADKAVDHDDEDELKYKQKTFETITNADGTTSVIEKKVEDNEEGVKIVTYDASGNKIKVEEYETEDGETKNRVKFYDASGVKLSDYRFETKDGKEVELRVKEGETELSRVKYNVEDQVLEVRTEPILASDVPSSDAFGEDDDHAKVRIRVVDDNFVVTHSGVDALSNFPLVVDDATGAISVKTPGGLVALNAMPDEILNKISSDDSLDNVDEIKFDSDSSSRLKYVVSGTKSKKLLGVFDLNLPSSLAYDASTGDLLGVNQGFVTRILDSFSF